MQVSRLVKFRRSKFSIMAKVKIVFVLMVFLVVLTGITGYYFNYTMNQRSKQYSDIIDEIELSGRLNTTMLLLESSVNGYIVTGNKKEFDDFRYRLGVAKEYLYLSESQIKANQIKAILSKLNSFIIEIEKDFGSLRSFRHKDISRSKSAQRIIKDLREVFLYVKNYLEIATLSLETQAHKAKLSQQDVSRTALLVLTLLLIIESIVVLVVGFILVRVILKPIQSIQILLSNVVDSMPSMLIAIDLDHKVIQWNKEAERATGVSSDDSIGKDLLSIIPRLSKEIAQVQDTINSGTPHSNVRRIEGDGGGFEETTIYPLFDKGVQGAVIQIDDVTEKIELEERVVQNEKMLSVGGLAAGMAHEINNPLAGMIQTSNVLNNRLLNKTLPANLKSAEDVGIPIDNLHEYMTKRQIPELIQGIIESGTRASEIVTNMLSFARRSDSSLSLQNIEALLDQTVDLLGSDFNIKSKFDFRQIKIVRDYEDNLPDIPCERGKIQQVILNILKNAAESMQDKKLDLDEYSPCFHLRLSHDKLTKMLKIEIQDNGQGIEREVQRRIFEPFFTTKSDDRGTGLGLSLSYFIITKNHNGELTVSSEIGVGTTFTIKLPCTKSQ